MYASTIIDLALLVTAIAALVGAVASVISASIGRKNRDTIREVHTEVKTMNGVSMGALADNAETRRIEEKPKEKRTSADWQHLSDVPPIP